MIAPLLMMVMVVATAAGALGESPEEMAAPSAPVEVRVMAERWNSVEVAWEIPDEDRPAPTAYRLYYRRAATANRDDHDPAGLIANHRLAGMYSLGTDTWEVWVCDVADGRLQVDVASAVSLLNREITPYFSWLSGGKYRAEFVAGGTVKADPSLSSEHARDYECDDRVAEVSEGGSDGAVIILDKDDLVSSGGAGSRSSLFLVDYSFIRQVTTGTFPNNGRDIIVTAEAVLPTSAHCSNCKHPAHINLDVVVHEMGHALGWPHSYGGNRPETSEALLQIGKEIDEYDNPMDMISGSPPERQLQEHGLVAGTIASNRYAAGWIDPEDLAFHQEPYGSYLLAPIGISGTQMLVLPTGTPGHFISLGARIASGYDAGLPAEGVEVYRIDQRAAVCAGEPPENPNRLTCTGLDRRTQQIPPPSDDDRDTDELTDHVYGPGERLTVEGFRVEVTERVSGRFRVWVGNPYKGTFADDEGSVHENSIESLVDRGITAGCDPNLKLYCPDQPITRAHMAQFLVLALGERGTRRSAGPSRFTDVPADAWHRPYVERLADLGITSGYPDGTFRPDVPVTRAQMAAFFARTFDRITLDTPDGVFADVPSDASHAAAVEGMFHAGITQGCEKTPGLNYCPDQPVRRDQMATFLIRALNIQA